MTDCVNENKLKLPLLLSIVPRSICGDKVIKCIYHQDSHATHFYFSQIRGQKMELGSRH